MNTKADIQYVDVKKPVIYDDTWKIGVNIGNCMYLLLHLLYENWRKCINKIVDSKLQIVYYKLLILRFIIVKYTYFFIMWDCD